MAWLGFCHGGQSLAFDGPDQRVYIWDIKSNRLRSRSGMFENSIFLNLRGTEWQTPVA